MEKRKRLRVRAIEQGYYGHKRRREGDVFELTDVIGFDKKAKKRVVKTPAEKTFSHEWMEWVEQPAKAGKGKPAVEAAEADFPRKSQAGAQA